MYSSIILLLFFYYSIFYRFIHSLYRKYFLNFFTLTHLKLVFNATHIGCISFFGLILNFKLLKKKKKKKIKKKKKKN